MDYRQEKSWRQVNIPVYILVIVFGMSSWVAVNGLFNELPLFVDRLPEKWALPSFLSVIIQLANIGPLIYTVAYKFAPSKIKEWPVIYGIIILGATATLLLTFFWNKTNYFGSVEHSTGLFTLTAILALVDCTSSVVFLPFIGYFAAQYMTALYIGEGFSGMIPGILGLFQGLGRDTKCENKTEYIFNKTTGHNESKTHVVPVNTPPNFSIEVYFILLFAILVCSGVSFTFLHLSHFAKKERTVGKNTEETGTSEEHLLENDMSSNNGEIVELITIGTKQYIFLLSVTVWLNFISNGFIPSIGSYASLPYGSTPYTLVVSLSNIINPIACFGALFFPSRSLKLVVGLVTTATALACYLFALGLMSPSPPLVGTNAGAAILVSWPILY